MVNGKEKQVKKLSEERCGADPGKTDKGGQDVGRSKIYSSLERRNGYRNGLHRAGRIGARGGEGRKFADVSGRNGRGARKPGYDQKHHGRGDSELYASGRVGGSLFRRLRGRS